MWITPKTDWKNGDSFLFAVNGDYERIKGNLLYLQNLSLSLYLPFSLAKMLKYSANDLPYVECFSALDDNADAIAKSTFSRINSQKARKYFAGGSCFSADDLNRIEGTISDLYADLKAAQLNRRTLNFTLGGDFFWRSNIRI